MNTPGVSTSSCRTRSTEFCKTSTNVNFHGQHHGLHQWHRVQHRVQHRHCKQSGIVDIGTMVDRNDPRAYLSALTEAELMYYNTYKQQFPNQVWQLNQDPLSDHGACSTEWALQTIIHNCHLLFFDGLPQPRWMFGTEVLSCLGNSRSGVGGGE